MIYISFTIWEKKRQFSLNEPDLFPQKGKMKVEEYFLQKTKITDRPPPLNPPTTQPHRKEKFYSGERLEAGQKNHNMALATPVHIQIVCKQQNNWHLTLRIKSNEA